MTVAEQIEILQKDVAQLTQLMVEKAEKAQDSEVKELSDKLAEVQRDLAERKKEFAVGTQIKVDRKELDTRMDELFIAKALCTQKDGSFDRAAFDKIKAVTVYADAIKAFGDVDAMTTTGTGTGAEFIPQAFSSSLQEEIWLSLEIANLFGRISMPASTYTLPFNPGRIIASKGVEGGTVNKRKPGTDNLVFTAKKIMSIVEMTDEFEQDSIVPALNFLRKQLIDGFALAQETMCLNGDPGTNLYASAITGEDARQLVKGIRADAMDASAGNCKVDLSTGGWSEDNIRALRAAMGKYGKKPSDLAIICSMADYNKMLKFTGYQSLYSYGAGAVILNGELGRMDNIPIIVTELLPKPNLGTDAADALGGLNATGKFDGATYTKATGVLVNKNAYMWGDRKEFALELWRNPMNQTTNLIGSQRLDFEKVLAATDPTTAVGYNY